MEFPFRGLTITAFDPDLHNTGWALTDVVWNTGKITHVKLIAGLMKIPRKLKGLEATSAMIAEIKGTEITPTDITWVEAQEVYADGKADANDLLRLAQITGALQLRFNATPVLPKVWKGNKTKEGMHQRARELVGSEGCEWESEYAPGLRQHAWDAICLALWAATQHLTNLDKKMLLSRGLPPPQTPDQPPL